MLTIYAECSICQYPEARLTLRDTTDPLCPPCFKEVLLDQFGTVEIKGLSAQAIELLQGISLEMNDGRISESMRSAKRRQYIRKVEREQAHWDQVRREKKQRERGREEQERKRKAPREPVRRDQVRRKQVRREQKQKQGERPRRIEQARREEQARGEEQARREEQKEQEQKGQEQKEQEQKARTPREEQAQRKQREGERKKKARPEKARRSEDFEDYLFEIELQRLKESKGKAPPLWSEMEEFRGIGPNRFR